MQLLLGGGFRFRAGLGFRVTVLGLDFRVNWLSTPGDCRVQLLLGGFRFRVLDD